MTIITLMCPTLAGRRLMAALPVSLWTLAPRRNRKMARYAIHTVRRATLELDQSAGRTALMTPASVTMELTATSLMPMAAVPARFTSALTVNCLAITGSPSATRISTLSAAASARLTAQIKWLTSVSAVQKILTVALPELNSRARQDLSSMVLCATHHASTVLLVSAPSAGVNALHLQSLAALSALVRTRSAASTLLRKSRSLIS